MNICWVEPQVPGSLRTPHGLVATSPLVPRFLCRKSSKGYRCSGTSRGPPTTKLSWTEGPGGSRRRKRCRIRDLVHSRRLGNRRPDVPLEAKSDGPAFLFDSYSRSISYSLLLRGRTSVLCFLPHPHLPGQTLAFGNPIIGAPRFGREVWIVAKGGG